MELKHLAAPDRMRWQVLTRSEPLRGKGNTNLYYRQQRDGRDSPPPRHHPAALTTTPTGELPLPSPHPRGKGDIACEERGVVRDESRAVSARAAGGRAVVQTGSWPLLGEPARSPDLVAVRGRAQKRMPSRGACSTGFRCSCRRRRRALWKKPMMTAVTMLRRRTSSSSQKELP